MSSWFEATNIWQIFPAAAIIISVIIYFKMRKIKSLSYEIVTATSLLTVDEELRGKIQVLYEDKPVKDLFLLVIEFLNDGNEPIRSDDFEEPITISFGPNVGVLSADLINFYPVTLNPKLQLINDRVILEKLLLNKNDVIKIKVLLTSFKSDRRATMLQVHSAGYLRNGPEFNAEKDVVLYARIIGVPEIRRIKSKGFRSVSPVIRVIRGLGMMFIPPLIWIYIFDVLGLAIYNEITHSSISSLADISITIYIIFILVASSFFIAGIVMTVSGLMDWYRK